MFQKLQISGEVLKALSLKMKILIIFVFSFLLVLSVMLQVPFSNIFNYKLLDPSNNSNDQLLDDITKDTKGIETETSGDQLIGGLLTSEFNEDSCISRYNKSLLYRKPSPYKPSEYLVSKLRSYEMRHKRCGPGTEAYKEATEKLSRDESYDGDECRYVLWIADYGLGNRMLTLVSVFLYALLTNRIILVDQSKDISDLFCEPFPSTTWLLPLDFPLMKQTYRYNKDYSRCYGTMVENHSINTTSIPTHLYLHQFQLHDSRDSDKMFFCQKDQSLIDKVPLLIFRANVYFVPSLWLNPTLQPELMKLFPQKQTVFHHLARYLFHPTNQVWDIVTKYYREHLSEADERLGIQIRVFGQDAGYFQHVMNQVTSCTQREKLLPGLASQEVNTSTSPKHNKAVLVTSLYPEYSQHLRNMYNKELKTETGEFVEIYQPSGERIQQTDKKSHDQKALAEMYLLSLTDNIVTSARSTFGYVSHSLGGLKPWLLYMPNGAKTPDPPCGRSTSMEPCYLTPPSHGCDADWKTHSEKVVPFVRKCEDDIWTGGLKLFDV